jgi:lysozyme
MNKEASIQVAMEFIKKWERLGSKSRSGGSYSPEQAKSLPLDTILYSFPDGQGYSIGWGSYNKLPDGTRVTANTTITKEKADYAIEYEIRNTIIPVIDKLITRPLTENQYAALISFSYNAGPYALNYNNFAGVINNTGDVESVLKKTATKDSGTGQISNGLINRRKDEAMLWNGSYNELYSYYLRNSSTINYGFIILVGVGLTFYIKYLKNKNIL